MRFSARATPVQPSVPAVKGQWELAGVDTSVSNAAPHSTADITSSTPTVVDDRGVTSATAIRAEVLNSTSV
jgi:hypothetical protein